MELGDRISPGRINTLGQRQGPSGFHACQREPGNLRTGDGQILGREGEILLLFAIEGVAGAGVESREPAAHEIVIDLGLDRSNGGHGCSGGVA